VKKIDDFLVYTIHSHYFLIILFDMATFSKKVSAFQTNFAAFLAAQAKEIGLSESILKEIMNEQLIEEVPSIKTIETIVLDAATKSMPKALPKAAKAEGPVAKAASGGAGSPPAPAAKAPTLKITYSHAAAAASAAAAPRKVRSKSPAKGNMNMPPMGAWADEEFPETKVQEGAAAAAAATAAASAAAPAPREPLSWKEAAAKEFTSSFTTVSPKKGGNSYFFYPRPISEIHKSLFDARTKKHPEDTLKEWLYDLAPEEFSAWLNDTTTIANYRDEDNRFTLATTIFAFIPFFVKHNLKKNVLKHLIYCISYAVIPEPTTSEESSCSSYFGLSPGDEPTEDMLREVAMIQAIQRYILANIETLLTSAEDKGEFKIASIDVTDSIKVSFRSEEALEKFSSAMRYNTRSHGFL